MKRFRVSTTLLSAAAGLVLLTGSARFHIGRALAAEPAFVASAVPQAQSPRAIRTLPNLQSITIWGSPFAVPGGSGQNSFTFAADGAELSARLNDPLGLSNKDYIDGPSFCDVFFSTADGIPNPDGAYLTIEGVTAQATDHVIVAEVGLHFSNQSAQEFEYGNVIASIDLNTTNGGVGELSHAIDGNRATSTALGRTVAGDRARITIGFRSSSGDPPCGLSINPISQTLPGDAAVGTLEVTAPNGCRWRAFIETFNSFVTITSRVATGTGTVSYSLTANDSANSRSETVNIVHLDFPFTIGQPFTIIQQGGVCGSYTYSIVPENLIFDAHGSDGIVSVQALNGCRWGAFANVDWISVDGPKYDRGASGSGRVDFKVSSNHGSWRQGKIDIAGKTFQVYQNPVDCPYSTVCAFFPRACPGGTLTGARSFRDEVLARTPQGQRYTRLYYQCSTEAVRVLMFNPMLMLRSREMLDRYEPVVQSMVEAKGTTLTRGDLDEIEGFLSSFAAQGSAEFQDAVKGVCSDLRDPDVHSAFGITVIDGPKRELAVAQSGFLRDSIIKPIAASAGLIGLIVIGARKRQRRARGAGIA